MDNVSRVFGSRTSTSTPKQTAINWPHGDQIARPTSDATLALAVHESHEVGMPVTTLGMSEWICWPYSFRIIDE